jgi:hypothetical protein
MADVAKQTHQDNPGDAPVPAQMVDADAPSRPSRRRLAGAGIASGVILTLKSPSAMGAAMCKAPSGAMSGGLSSRKPTQAPTCQGRPPTWWAEQSCPMPKNCTAFSHVFTCSSRTLTYASQPVMKVLKAQNYDRDQVGMYLMAAYFNAYTGRTSFLKVPAVIAIWNEWQASGANLGGTYTPIAGGRKWGSREIVGYLKSTME